VIGIVKRNSIFGLLSLDLKVVVESVGTVKKPSVVGEALFKPLWESAW
jgi:hypothetical protein